MKLLTMSFKVSGSIATTSSKVIVIVRDKSFDAVAFGSISCKNAMT